MWVCEHVGVVPDIIITAKGIASGLPLGVTVARAELIGGRGHMPRPSEAIPLPAQRPWKRSAYWKRSTSPMRRVWANTSWEESSIGRTSIESSAKCVAAG